MSDKLLIPFSIIFAGLLIGGGFYLGDKRSVDSQKLVEKAVDQSSNIRAITSEDHIIGNPKARVIVVEYSDTECPFCKQFHSTMRQIMQNYGTNGDVAWTYRHFPIEELHKKGPKEAEALECAAEIGGNSKFWEYTNRIYEVTPSNDGLASSELVVIAKQVGLPSDKFNTCFSSGKYAPKVAVDIADARKAGGEGTPHSVIVDTKTGDTYPLPGAQPYATVKGVIDIILES